MDLNCENKFFWKYDSIMVAVYLWQKTCSIRAKKVYLIRQSKSLKIKQYSVTYVYGNPIGSRYMTEWQ